MSRVSASIIAAFVLAAPQPVEGQDLHDQRWRSPSAVEDTAGQHIRATRLMPLAIIGSIAGTYFGAIAGDRMRFVGSDRSDYSRSLYIGSVLGGTIGSTLGVLVSSDQRISGRSALTAGAIGAAGGVAGVVVLDAVRGDSFNWAEMWIGFSVTQGTVASVVAPKLEAR